MSHFNRLSGILSFEPSKPNRMPFLKRSLWLKCISLSGHVNILNYLELYFLAKDKALHVIKAWSENGLQLKSESEVLFKPTYPTYILGQTK